jgi:hypothetical protein
MSEVGSSVGGVRELLFPSSPVQRSRLRRSARAAAVAFADECEAIAGMVEQAAPHEREFVSGEVACVLHLAPATATAKVATALAITAQPLLLAALRDGRLGVGGVLVLVGEVEHLDAENAQAVLAAVLESAVLDADGADDRTPGELRSAAKKAILQVDRDLARRRHEQAKQQADVRGRAMPDGMGRITIDCTAVEMAQALAAVQGRAAAMSFDEDLTAGQQRVAAALHALGCERTQVQAVFECPVETAVDVHAAAGSAVWSVDVRMPVAVALGLSDHPALLAGYGPIDADHARALLPAADLLKACVDATTGEVLAVERPVRAKTWQAGDPDRARALRDALVEMATSGGELVELCEDGYVPSAALGRLVDLRDVTSVFPGDATPARRTERDHRTPYPLGPTSAENLNNLSKHWHRAKHEGGWQLGKRPDGAYEWISPTRGVYVRRPTWTAPPPLERPLPPLE